MCCQDSGRGGYYHLHVQFAFYNLVINSSYLQLSAHTRTPLSLLHLYIHTLFLHPFTSLSFFPSPNVNIKQQLGLTLIFHLCYLFIHLSYYCIGVFICPISSSDRGEHRVLLSHSVHHRGSSPTVQSDSKSRLNHSFASHTSTHTHTHTNK